MARLGAGVSGVLPRGPDEVDAARIRGGGGIHNKNPQVPLARIVSP
jgi:hypothetical protein